MKAAFEKLREDVGPIRAWGSSTDGQLGHRGQRPSLVEIRGILRQVACGGAHTAALTDDGVLYIWGAAMKASVSAIYVRAPSRHR